MESNCHTLSFDHINFKHTGISCYSRTNKIHSNMDTHIHPHPHTLKKKGEKKKKEERKPTSTFAYKGVILSIMLYNHNAYV